MLAALGSWLNRKIARLLYALGFFYNVLYETLFFVRKKQVGLRILMWQILFTGFEALSIISVISLAIGAVIIITGQALLPQFGQGQLMYSILITIIVRELGPILTAFFIIARSGTAIATELGGMVVSHQIEAYVSVGINPISYLVVPRFLGVVISMMILTVYFIAMGIFGAYFVAQIVRPMPFVDYFENLVKALKLVDIFSALLKSFVFGTIISVVSTYQGFNVKVSSTELPVVVIKAVGQGFALCVVADIIIVMVLRLGLGQ